MLLITTIVLKYSEMILTFWHIGSNIYNIYPKIQNSDISSDIYPVCVAQVFLLISDSFTKWLAFF